LLFPVAMANLLLDSFLEYGNFVSCNYLQWMFIWCAFVTYLKVAR